MKKLVFIILTFLIPSTSHAGIPVIDYTNLVQNILTAVRTLQSNINEATQIANQVQSLANETKNLKNLKYDVIQNFNGQFTDLFRTVGTINGLMQDLSSLQNRFDQLYPDYNSQYGAIPSYQMSGDTQSWIAETRKMMLGAAKTGAQVLQNLPQSQSELETLMRKSQNSAGILQATQAGNQIAATVAGGLINLNSQMASYSQAHTAYLMEINSSAAMTKNRMDHALDDWAQPSNSHLIPENPF